MPLDNTMDDHKSKALAAALAQIEKQFGKGSIMKMGESQVQNDLQVVSTGSLGLDIALGVGGLPRGRVVEIYGPESSGKTTLSLQVVAQVQKAGGTAAYIDAANYQITCSLDGNAAAAATESMTMTSTPPERTSMSAISSPCSPVSGCEISISATLTPSFPA